MEARSDGGLAGGHRRLNVYKDKQLFSRGDNLLLREDTEEFCQEMIPKGIGRPPRCYGYSSR